MTACCITPRVGRRSRAYRLPPVPIFQLLRLYLARRAAIDTLPGVVARAQYSEVSAADGVVFVVPALLIVTHKQCRPPRVLLPNAPLVLDVFRAAAAISP